VNPAAPDGSTLKATAPVPQSPINGVKIPLGTPVTLVVTNSTTLVSLSLSYRFEVSDAAGAIVESTLVPAGSGTTSHGDGPAQKRADLPVASRPGIGTSRTLVCRHLFVGANEAMWYAELFDPLTNSKTIARSAAPATSRLCPGRASG
jgi:hypothetical protein